MDQLPSPSHRLRARGARFLGFSDRAIESQFQQHYGEQSLPQLRIVFWTLIVLAMALSLAATLEKTLPGIDGSFLISGAPLVLFSSGAGLLLTRARGFAGWSQWYLTLQSLAIGLTVVIGDAGRPYEFAAFMILCIGIYTVLRLRLIAATAVVSLLMAVYSTQQLRLGAGFVPFSEQIFFIAGLNIVGVLAGYQMETSARLDFALEREIRMHRDRADELLHTILPRSIAKRLQEGDGKVAGFVPHVTVLFADIADFTRITSELPPRRLLELLNRIFSTFDEIAARIGVEKVKTVGDAYVAALGLLTPHPRQAGTLVEVGAAMIVALKDIGQEYGLELHLRVGIDSGPVVAGVLGTQKFSYDMWGDAVNTANRMCTYAGIDEIQITSRVHHELRQPDGFEVRLLQSVKGKGDMPTYYKRF